MLLPFLPRNPHLFAGPTSLEPSPGRPAVTFLWARLRPGLGGPRCTKFGLPPRMAATDECCDRAYFCMADVIAMHSEMTSDTGSTATDTGRLLYCIRDDCGGPRRGTGVPGTESKIESMVPASRLILQSSGEGLRE